MLQIVRRDSFNSEKFSKLINIFPLLRKVERNIDRNSNSISPAVRKQLSRPHSCSP